MCTYYVHAFRLTASGSDAVYVGVSWVTPEARLREHLSGYKASRHVRCGAPELAPDLYGQLPAYSRRYLADQAADQLAADLVRSGHDVRADPNRLRRVGEGER